LGYNPGAEFAVQEHTDEKNHMAARRTLSDIRMGYDMYERHRAVGTLLGAGLRGTVLDVGGIRGSLSRFMPHAEVLALNVDGTGDRQYDGGAIPFADGAFDTVVSLDTLEHVPPAARAAFLGECMRVARRMLLVAAPYGSPGHGDYEARLDELYRTVHGDYHRWLHEHVVNGLPTEENLEDYRRLLVREGFTATTFYCGDYGWQCRGLQRSLTLHRSLGPLRRLSAGYDLLMLAAPWPVPTFEQQPAATTNRFYLRGERVKEEI
jgi:SAM-dependent methyltransferase